MLQAMNIKKSLSPLWEKEPGGARRPADASNRKSRAELRVQKDVEELSYDRFVVGRTVTRVNFPAGTSNLLRCVITICPREGSYDGAEIQFELEIGERYPFSPPRVTCHTRVFHPNIDWRNGSVSLGLLSPSSWKPVLTINTVLFQLQTLFISPGSDLDNACNDDARRLFMMNPGNGACGSPFDSFVKRTLKGGHFFGVKWAPILAALDGSGAYHHPVLGRSLSDDRPPVSCVGANARAQQERRGPKRGKRSRDPSPELDESMMSGLNQLAIRPVISPGRQKRRRDREFLSDTGGSHAELDDPTFSTLSKRSRFGVLDQSVDAPYPPVAPMPQLPHSASALLGGVQHPAATHPTQDANHGAPQSFEPVKKRARPPPLTLNGLNVGSDILSDADRLFHAQGLAHARRSPVFPVNAFGLMTEEKQAAATPKPSRNRAAGVSGSRSRSRSHTSRSPAQRSSLAPLLNPSPSARSSPSADSACHDTENSHFGTSLLPQDGDGARGAPADTNANTSASLRASSRPDFSMLNIGRQALGQTGPIFGQGQGNSLFAPSQQQFERVPPLRETNNFDSGSAFSVTVGGLESSGSAMMDDDETENSGPCV